MASNYTPNLNLCQWAEEDPVLREDFNEDNAKIDAAFATKCEMYIGTYTGDGATNRTITLGFQPKFVWLWQSGTTCPFYNNYDAASAIAALGHPAVHYNKNTALEITDTGFIASYKPNLGNNYDVYLNNSGITYVYLALK